VSKVFDCYAQYYDLLYRDKNYPAEAEYVASHIRARCPTAKRILELGCGTGAHAAHLARMGYSVHGIDFSEAMLAGAAARAAALPREVGERLSFSASDVRSARTGETYDAVVALFHVMSYQTTNADLAATFESAAIHLRQGGLFLFDFWYGPGVLTQVPQVRVKRLEDENIKVTRIAEPVVHENENLVEVNYTVFIDAQATGAVHQVRELHKMRYLFLPELLCLADQKQWCDIRTYGWMSHDELSHRDWAGVALATKT